MYSHLQLPPTLICKGDACMGSKHMLHLGKQPSAFTFNSWPSLCKINCITCSVHLLIAKPINFKMFCIVVPLMAGMVFAGFRTSVFCWNWAGSHTWLSPVNPASNPRSSEVIWSGERRNFSWVPFWERIPFLKEKLSFQGLHFLECAWIRILKMGCSKAMETWEVIVIRYSIVQSEEIFLNDYY